MGIHHHEQDIGLPSKRGFISCKKGLGPKNNCILCKKKKIEFMCRLKINHAWSAPSSCV
jgi:hypothetical protein